ncbi:hypothetical protein NEOKW01_1726 [Nematocida sp. AWRm80]|nr:hypothetical protein NEOKW01_0313 [Nematocida sp. AWRm80]KAI5181550.1 hypothetical protein NEOKW01_1726 [Nematocida sp. AWRm80]
MRYGLGEGMGRVVWRTYFSGVRGMITKMPVVLYGVILYFMYVLTIGEKMFDEKTRFGSMAAKNTSIMLFAIGCLVSQGLFFLFSSFDGGLMSSPISESFAIIQVMQASIVVDAAADQAYSTLFCCLFLSAALTGLGFCILYMACAERVIKGIPPVVSNCMFVVVGIRSIQYANERLGNISVGLSAALVIIMFNAVGVLFCLFFYLTENRHPFFFKYSVLVILVSLLSVFYFFVAVLGTGIDALIGYGWLAADPRVGIVYELPSFSRSGIDFAVVGSNASSIFSIVVVNIVQFVINFPPIKEQTRKNACIKKELLVNAVANTATAFLGTSSYMLAYSTIAITSAGSQSKLDSLLIALVFGALFFTAYRLFFYIPFVIFDMMLLYLGMNVVMRTFLSVIQESIYTVPLIAFVAAVSILMNSILWGAVAAGIICVLLVYVPPVYRWAHSLYGVSHEVSPTMTIASHSMSFEESSPAVREI